MRLIGEVRADRPLVVVALEEESAHLGDRTPVLLTGVGKVNAAVAVSAVLARARPALVVNVGTAGACGPDGRVRTRCPVSFSTISMTTSCVH